MKEIRNDRLEPRGRRDRVHRGTSPSRCDAADVDDRRPIDDVTEALKDVVDPELGINVVDLGLVYGVHLDDDTNVASST